jgi:hypothetical protein
MSDSKVRRAFRTTKIKINKDTVPSAEQRDALEALFMTMEAAKTDAVAAERSAGITTAKARTKGAQALIAELEFLQTAAGNFTQVAGDRIWVVYRDQEGTIVLEGFTERLLRNNMRAQQEMLGKQLTSDDTQGEVDRSGLYESEGEDDDNTPDQGPEEEEN